MAGTWRGGHNISGPFQPLHFGGYTSLYYSRSYQAHTLKYRASARSGDDNRCASAMEGTRYVDDRYMRNRKVFF